MNYLEADHLTFRYFERAKHNILDDASLTIASGTITVLLGSSGCGKSTLAAVCAGLYPENGGQLLTGQRLLGGQDIQLFNPPMRSRHLSLMFQNPDLQFCMDTLRKELIFCLENQSQDVKTMEAVIDTMASRFSMETLLDRRFHTLSGGEKQKAALCCLLALGSEGILLDEPFSNIDSDSTAEIITLLKKQNQEHGTTVIAIDHQPEPWLEAADEFILIGKGGRVVRRGITGDNMADYRELLEGEGVIAPHSLLPKPQQRTFTTPALALEQVSISHHKKEPCLLKDISHTFYYGQLTALMGPSGSGKTTLFHALLKQKPFQGSICLDGHSIQKIRERDLFPKIGMVFQNPSQQFTTTNVYEEVIESLKIWQKNLTEEERAWRAKALLEEYGLWVYKKYSPYMLSQGQQRRLAVLSVLCGGQKILLLDEPTYGQDGRSTRIIMDQLKQKAEADGLCVIFSTHDSRLAQEYADVICHIPPTPGDGDLPQYFRKMPRKRSEPSMEKEQTYD